jgi:hypothetical protein
MAAYSVVARVDRVKPHFAGTAPPSGDALRVPEPLGAPEAIDLVGPSSLPRVVERWIEIREAWAQTTFYLFDAEGWR